MSWSAVLADTMTGALGAPVDIPSFRWSVSVSDSSLSTTRDKGTGSEGATGLQLPWSAVPAGSQEGRESALASWRRSVALLWDRADGTRVPVVFGAIGERTDSWEDTSFDLQSPWQLLDQRVLCPEGRFGAGAGSTTQGQVAYEGRSLRAIACAIVRDCTYAKPGGELPIDLPYLDELGGHERHYDAFNAQNDSARKLLEALSNVQGGPDIQLRPYLADGSHVRLRLEAGSDSEPYLSQTGLVHTLTAFPGGGTIEGLRVAHLAPVMRVYASGKGQDQSQLCHLSEDLSLCRRADPWPLVEEVASFPDDEGADVLRRHADARLVASKVPLCQLQGQVWLGEPGGIEPGDVWPGQLVDVSVEGHPALPDGTYRLRLMQAEGDESRRCTLTFDPIANPWYS